MSTNHDAKASLSRAVQDAAVLSVAQAQGVLAERYDLTFDGALAVLDRRAQHAGIPLVEAARWLLTAGTLP
ncbi:ANTAR domain-containing protein [Kribbella sp. NPDC026611]|uniref:ANTAR domain-containing protein n=1 Tax=Kribbella sp. NPDC026611 TaxID=3154911 RepID=UPI0033E04C76